MFIGRAQENDLIQRELQDTTRPHLIILYGRRRVGKSRLIRESLEGKKNVLFFEGIEGKSTRIQIDQFLTDLSKQTGRVKLAAKNWREVFAGVGEIIQTGNWTLVFDEFPWMASGRAQIVADLKYAWEKWSQNPRITLFLCGSVASFMVKHLVHSKALHNRKTLEICLNPLSPQETGLFIPKRSADEKALLYMTVGGVPKYLEQFNSAQSVEKNINRLCLTKNGFFVNEFETLFKEQFTSTQTYETIVQILVKSPQILAQISKNAQIARGGGLKEQTDNLVRAQFVRDYVPLNVGGGRRTRTKIYKVVDPFLLFYFSYILPNLEIIQRNENENLFASIVLPTLNQYRGLAFERLCEDSIMRILHLLGLKLADVLRMGSFFRRPVGDVRGLQIDWLIMRRDGVWNVLECKYHNKPVGSWVIDDVKKKIEMLNPPDSVTIEPVLIASHGATKDVSKTRYFNQVITLKDLMGR